MSIAARHCYSEDLIGRMSWTCAVAGCLTKWSLSCAGQSYADEPSVIVSALPSWSRHSVPNTTIVLRGRAQSPCPESCQCTGDQVIHVKYQGRAKGDWLTCLLQEMVHHNIRAGSCPASAASPETYSTSNPCQRQKGYSCPFQANEVTYRGCHDWCPTLTSLRFHAIGAI